jgi:Flp pilus assembly protein TadB
MNNRLLPISVQTHTVATRWRRRMAIKLRQAWADRADESGIDEAVTKMIWLAVGIGVALAATAFFMTVFQTAQSNVPDPITP